MVRPPVPAAPAMTTPSRNALRRRTGSAAPRAPCRAAAAASPSRWQPGTTEIGVFARSQLQVERVAEIRVTRIGPPTAAEIVPKPKLYALIVGISDYADPAYKLEFAAKDAHDFAGSLANQNGALYSEVDIKLLVDQQATAVAIKDGLDWLTHQVTDRDVGIVYLAGHGIVDEQSLLLSWPPTAMPIGCVPRRSPRMTSPTRSTSLPARRFCFSTPAMPGRWSALAIARSSTTTRSSTTSCTASAASDRVCRLDRTASEH